MNIDSIIEKNFSGVISVKKNNEIMVQKTHGYADIVNKIPNEIDTRFGTASAGKVFVAVGILQLIEKGKLHFDDTIGSILDIDLKSIDQNITIRQLLTHTSGIPDYFDEETMEEYADLWKDIPNYRIRKSMDLVPLFIDKPMMYKPGEKFKYNNTGFVVLGLIIEKLEGILFDEYLRKNIFKPSGMDNTGYYELDRLPSKCANSYIYDESKKDYYTNIYSIDVKGTGAGGAFTTAIDVNRFWKKLLSGKLLSEEYLNQMLTLQSGNDEDDEYYGYGIWLEKTKKNTYEPWFQGSDPGVSFLSSYNRSKGIEITLVSNKGDDVWKIHKKIKKIIV